MKLLTFCLIFIAMIVANQACYYVGNNVCVSFLCPMGWSCQNTGSNCGCVPGGKRSGKIEDYFFNQNQRLKQNKLGILLKILQLFYFHNKNDYEI